MYFHHLSHNDLIANFTDLVQKERQLTAQVLACIVEIDRRQLYLEKGYSSLFDFLVRDYGYSPGAASTKTTKARSVIVRATCRLITSKVLAVVEVMISKIFRFCAAPTIDINTYAGANSWGR